MIFLWESKSEEKKNLEISIILNRYKAIKRDNDSVYFEKVPALSSLPVVQGKFY
jgi:hypothetical protein